MGYCNTESHCRNSQLLDNSYVNMGNPAVGNLHGVVSVERFAFCECFLVVECCGFECTFMSRCMFGSVPFV